MEGIINPKLKRYTIKNLTLNTTEEIDSWFTPGFEWYKGELMISIVGRDCQCLYFADNFTIVKVEEI